MKIKTAQLEQVMMTHALINQPGFIFGRPGVGKTQEIQRIGKPILHTSFVWTGHKCLMKLFKVLTMYQMDK